MSTKEIKHWRNFHVGVEDLSLLTEDRDHVTGRTEQEAVGVTRVGSLVEVGGVARDQGADFRVWAGKSR